ncbi:serine hydrolase domain-containing protein, partial [Bacteroidota bacterium]
VWINELMNYYKIPGMAVGIVYDQNLVYSKGFGFADLNKKTAVTDETLFRIASITKLFTGTAIMQLRDEGKLKLDDPVEKYLNWFRLKNPFGDIKKVTIRQILTHTSGIPREAAFPYWTDSKFPTLDEIEETIDDQSMIFRPETEWKYSNLGISLLGEIIEVVSGISYEDYVTLKILRPLEMENTKVQIDKHDPMLATGYLHKWESGKREVAPFTDSKGITAAANMSTNIKDLAKFCSLQFLYSDSLQNSILKSSTLMEMHRVHWIRSGWKSGWGLAFATFKDEDQLYVGHAGWVAGFRSQLLFNPDDKVGVIVFINAEDYSPYKIANQLYKLIAGPLKKIYGQSSDQYEFDSSWEKFTGKYVDPTHWYTDVIILNKKLYFYDYNHPPSDNPNSNLILLYPEGENLFRMKDGNGEIVKFELNDEGSVKRIKRGENYTYPL